MKMAKKFECKFFEKDKKGCRTECPKHRMVCCYECPTIVRCVTVPEIKEFICTQVLEAKGMIEKVEEQNG
jgi:hypothetical protein